MAEETKKAEQAETPETEKETVAKETQAQEQTVEETPAKAELTDCSVIWQSLKTSEIVPKKKKQQNLTWVPKMLWKKFFLS